MRACECRRRAGCVELRDGAVVDPAEQMRQRALRRIAQNLRSVRVREDAVVAPLKHTVARERIHEPLQRIAVRTDLARELGDVLRPAGERVRNARVGDHPQRPRH